ncbi:uncharacterized protein [Lolium perenne]|uniref:uncharacterized protein n=1 Tax=Lolium perenne TaxID=4522 RepID=UPI0021F58DD5|nr:uncharacterized protein LOC127343005 isoform X2 [Lolium perenne]
MRSVHSQGLIQGSRCCLHLRQRPFAQQQDTESAVTAGKFDDVLDTIGVPESERDGINLLRRGGHYMALQLSFSCATAITREDLTVEKKEIKTLKKPALFRLFFIIEHI